MEFKCTSLVLCLLFLASGCGGESNSPRDEAEQAQQALEEARQDAAELIADSEAEAVDILADAKRDAADEISDAKRDAEDLVEDAEKELDEKMQQLNAPENVQPEPVPADPAR